MTASILVTLGSIKAIFPIIILAKVLGLKHGVKQLLKA